LGGTNKDLANLERTKDKPQETEEFIAADPTVSFFYYVLYI
jgi:hypothetical protein